MKILKNEKKILLKAGTYGTEKTVVNIKTDNQDGVQATEATAEKENWCGGR